MRRRYLFLLLVPLFLWILNYFLSNPAWVSPYLLQVLVLMGVNAIVAVSWDLIAGVTGQFSIGQAGFMAIGAYSSAYLTLRLHFPFAIALFCSALFACLAGLLVGIPTLRLRGDYLAIATLGFGEIVRVALINMESVGGARGMRSIPQFSSFFNVYLALAIVLWVCLRLLNSQQGRALQAIREDEVSAQAMGVDVVRFKVFAFALSALIAGVAGVFYAHWVTFLHPDIFGFMKSVEIILMGVLGGMGTIYGAALGGALITLLPEGLRLLIEQSAFLYQNKEFIRLLLFSVLLLIFIIARPQGILGSRTRGLRQTNRARSLWSRALLVCLRQTKRKG